MAGFPEGCCDIKRPITSTGIDCAEQKGGAYDLRIACKRYVTFSEYDCDGVDSAGGAVGISGDRHAYDIATADDLGVATPLFFTVETRDKTLEYLWECTFDPDSGNRNDTETLNFQVDIKSREFYCTIKEMIGQQIVAIFREKASERFYLVGRYGGLTVNNISGGTGTTDFTPTTFVISGDDITEYFIELYDGTSIASTETLVDSLTDS